MARKPTRLKKLRLIELSLVPKGANQFSSIGIYKAAEPAPVVITAEALSPEGVEALRQFSDSMTARLSPRNTVEKKADTMSDYAALCAHYANVYDTTPEQAGVLLHKRRPDLVANAYAAEEQAYQQRQIDKRKAAYGDAA